MMRLVLVATMTSLAFVLSGCSLLEDGHGTGYATLLIDSADKEAKATAETCRAAEQFQKGHFERAEKLLKDALAADVNYAPAHNNLGNLYFARGEFYLAAWEFEYANRLMPERPEPLNNLGLVYEQIGRLDKAIEYFTAAYMVNPQNPESIANLARARLKQDSRDPEIPNFLSELLLHDTRPDRIEWAQEQLAVGKFSAPPATMHISSQDGPPPDGARPAELIPPATVMVDPTDLRNAPVLQVPRDTTSQPR
jgi:tetratricopeptide (TPR) repeat protein